MEVIVGGLESVTLVFMDLEEDEQGDIELKGDRYRKGALQIIDTGYGLERFCWANGLDHPPSTRRSILRSSISRLDCPRTPWRGQVLDLDRVLADISRLMGIMNIEPGSDAGAMQDHLIERLEAAERRSTRRPSSESWVCSRASMRLRIIPRCDAYDGRQPATECESGGIR